MQNTVPLIMIVLIAGCAHRGDEAPVSAGESPPGVPFGISLASVEEGARILSVARLLPFDHPDSEAHEFPNPQQFSRDEVRLLVSLGRQVGLGLHATLTRYPSLPGPWPYAEFAPPPTALFMGIQARSVEATAGTVPGTRIVAFLDREAVAFIIDTRGMTLAERGMNRATTMGIDARRRTLLDGFAELAEHAPARGPGIVIVKKAMR